MQASRGHTNWTAMASTETTSRTSRLWPRRSTTTFKFLPIVARYLQLVSKMVQADLARTPQGLKPLVFPAFFGPTEVVPLLQNWFLKHAVGLRLVRFAQLRRAWPASMLYRSRSQRRTSTASIITYETAWNTRLRCSDRRDADNSEDKLEIPAGWMCPAESVHPMPGTFLQGMGRGNGVGAVSELTIP